MNLRRLFVVVFIVLFGTFLIILDLVFVSPIVKENSLNKIIANEDSLFKYVSKTPSIHLLDIYIAAHPFSRHLSEAKEIRRKLFFDIKEVQKAGLNIDTLLSLNPCYTPLYLEMDYINKKSYQLKELINDQLPESNPFRNRFLVGDFNTIDKNGFSLGIKEQFADIEDIWEFNELVAWLWKSKTKIEDLTKFSEVDFFKKVKKEKNSRNLEKEFIKFQNFFEKVERFKSFPISKKVSILYGRAFNTGQKICLCELEKDTIKLISKFATSALGTGRIKTTDPKSGRIITKKIFLTFPTGYNREYYAPYYRLSSRCWDTERKYEDYEYQRDSLMGGGSKFVVKFERRYELPNFLLLEPDSSFHKAMHGNGMHRVALGYLPGGMLGNPNSLGCLRLTDYACKFARWWVPNNAKLFIYYDDNRYFSYKVKNQFDHKVPFKSVAEGDKFRIWAITNYPMVAKRFSLDSTGSYNNGTIMDCYDELNSYYKQYLEGKIKPSKK
jgi:hypothetical protein